MTLDDDAAAATAVSETAQAQADFDAGAAMEHTGAKGPPAATPDKPEPAAKPEVKPAAAAAAPATPDAPKYVQITEEQFARFNAAADKTASFEQQFSKAFGTLGDLQKLVRTLQSDTPRGLKVEIPKDAFAGMAKDFPELADHFRAGLENALKGVTGTSADPAPPDPDEIRRTVADRIQAIQVEALEDDFPDWRQVVGAVAVGQSPDPANPFRKWLATKSEAFQARINGTQSAAVIAKAITSFQKETATPPAATAPAQAPKPDPKAQQAQQRQERIREAIQPRGDNARAAPATNEEDEFMAGFKSG